MGDAYLNGHDRMAGLRERVTTGKEVVPEISVAAPEENESLCVEEEKLVKEKKTIGRTPSGKSK